jgi:hypothetical protein
MNSAIATRLADLITLAERLKAAVEGKRPGALLPTFPMMRMALDADAMANALAGHVERLIPQPEGNRGKSTA